MLQIESIREEAYTFHDYINDAFWALQNGMVTKDYISHLILSAHSRGVISGVELNAYMEMLKVAK